jgi:hypothetical protein
MIFCTALLLYILYYYYLLRGPGSLVGIATELRALWSGDRIPVGVRFSACPDRPCGPPSLLYNRYQVFPGGKVRPGRAADRSPPSSAKVFEEQSYTSTPLRATMGPVTGLPHFTITYSTTYNHFAYL